MDPRIARIEANYVTWGADVKQTKNEIKLVDCNELLDGGAYEGQSNN